MPRKQTTIAAPFKLTLRTVSLPAEGAFGGQANAEAGPAGVAQEWWVATIEAVTPEAALAVGALEIGRIAVGALRHADLRERFAALMSDVLRAEFESVGLAVAEMRSMPAPAPAPAPAEGEA